MTGASTLARRLINRLLQTASGLRPAISAGEAMTSATGAYRCLDRLPADVAAVLAQYGWRRMPLWFEDYVKERNQ